MDYSELSLGTLRLIAMKAALELIETNRDGSGPEFANLALKHDAEILRRSVAGDKQWFKRLKQPRFQLPESVDK